MGMGMGMGNEVYRQIVEENDLRELLKEMRRKEED